MISLEGKTVIVTGGSAGIGLEIVQKFYDAGANAAIIDLAASESIAAEAIRRLGDTTRVMFFPADVTCWEDMSLVFTRVRQVFGRIDIVVANAGIMESRRFFDFETDDSGNVKEDKVSGRVIDVNLKGTMNTLRLAVFHMQQNEPDVKGWRGSVVLVSSTSGYIGGTEVVSYVSSKHGVIGLLRAAHPEAKRRQIRVNAVAPFVTPTSMTSSYSEAWKSHGLPTNSPAGVANAVFDMTSSTDQQGGCFLVSLPTCIYVPPSSRPVDQLYSDCYQVIGDQHQEIEPSYKSSLGNFVGHENEETFRKAGEFFRDVGGYPLPVSKP